MQLSHDIFRKIAHRTSAIVGSSWAFILALILIIGWAFSGPFFEFSDTWQLIINTGTTILTFLMVFLIQNTQNRDARAIHLKLDELIKSMRSARDDFIDIEDLPDKDLETLGEEFKLKSPKRPDKVILKEPDEKKEKAKALLEEFSSKSAERIDSAKEKIVKELARREKVNKQKKFITNDDVQNLLDISDSTATRYLDSLEDDGRIKQQGKSGRGVKYIAKK